MITKLINEKTFLSLTLLAFVISIHSSYAKAEPSVTPNSEFIQKQSKQIGWTKYQYPLNGEYVYQTNSKDTRLQNKPILIDKPQRTQYEFMSAEEQAHLQQLQTDNENISSLESTAPINKTKHHHKHLKRVKSNLKWPRIIVQDDDVCVPTLEFSEAEDWKDHLTCHARSEELKNGR